VISSASGLQEGYANKMKSILRSFVIMAVLLATDRRLSAQNEANAMEQQIFYRSVKVDGLSIFYREAGPKDAPLILLLHGLPSSSRMFQPLLTRLADKYHLVAPDYPGFGHSEWPDPKQFAYSFDRIASMMNGFTQALGLSHYTLYMQVQSASVWRWRILSECRLSSSRMPSLTTKALVRTGLQGVHSGQTEPLTKSGTQKPAIA
jgi:hypothetical protein